MAFETLPRWRRGGTSTYSRLYLHIITQRNSFLFTLQNYSYFPSLPKLVTTIFQKNKGGVQNVPSLYLCRRRCCVFSFYGILIPDGGHRENRTISPLTQMPILVIGRSRKTAPLTGLRTTYLLAFREIFQKSLHRQNCLKGHDRTIK